MLEFVVQDECFNCPVPKRPTSQPEALLDEGFHGRAALVGSLASLILVLNGGGGHLKNHAVYPNEHFVRLFSPYLVLR